MSPFVSRHLSTQFLSPEALGYQFLLPGYSELLQVNMNMNIPTQHFIHKMYTFYSLFCSLICFFLFNNPSWRQFHAGS